MAMCNPLDGLTDVQGDGSGATTVAVGTAPGDGSATAGAVTSSSTNVQGKITPPGQWAVVKCDLNVEQDVYLVMDGLRGTTGVATEAYSPAFVFNAQTLKQDQIKRVSLIVRDNWGTNHQHDTEGQFVQTNIWGFRIGNWSYRGPGMYLGVFCAFGHDDRPLWVRHCYVEVRDNALDGRHGFGLSIATVRLHLMDNMPSANTLIDDLEYGDAQIAEMITSCVDYFNEIAPDVGRYTTTNFPWRHHLLQGVMGQLLKMASRQKLRNFVDISAGGMTVNKERRWTEYAQVGQQMWQEYTQWANRKKVQIDCGLAFGSMPGRAIW